MLNRGFLSDKRMQHGGGGGGFFQFTNNIQICFSAFYLDCLHCSHGKKKVCYAPTFCLAFKNICMRLPSFLLSKGKKNWAL